MTLSIPCPACGTVLQANVFDLGPLDDKAKSWIAEITMEEHRKVCKGWRFGWDFGGEGFHKFMLANGPHDPRTECGDCCDSRLPCYCDCHVSDRQYCAR